MHSADRQIQNLRRVLDVSRRLADTTDLPHLMGGIIDAACEVLDCERATVFLFDPKRNELYSVVAKGADTIRVPLGIGIAGSVARDRQIVHVPDAYADARFNPEFDKRSGFRTRNILCFPMENVSGDLMGVLQALNKRTGHQFTPEDHDLAGVLSAQAGVALHRWRLLAEFAEKQRMQRDLELARDIQLRFLPQKLPPVAMYELAGRNSSADETGGDTYDFIALPDGRLAILLADATGHGIGPALLIANWRSLVRALLAVSNDLAVIAAHVDRLLSQDVADGRFVTAFIGILDPVGHTIEYVSGGHGPILFFHGQDVEARNATAPPFAIGLCTDFTPETFPFAPGDMLLILTDGLFEAIGPGDEQFSVERVITSLKARQELPADAMLAGLFEDVFAFTRPHKPGDDLTAVALRRAESQ